MPSSTFGRKDIIVWVDEKAKSRLLPQANPFPSPFPPTLPPPSPSLRELCPRHPQQSWFIKLHHQQQLLPRLPPKWQPPIVMLQPLASRLELEDPPGLPLLLPPHLYHFY